VKTYYKLILRSYIGPFIATFLIAIFIMLMQFLWKYVDDLVGKGLEWYIVVELLLYASATFVPLALPLAILLSSIMTMGSLGENYELVALKSAGISLTKIMLPLFVISMFLAITGFYFANNVLPAANLRMGSLLYDIRQQRPAFNIMDGVYYKGIDNFVIRVEERDSDGQTMKNIKIYDHTQQKGNINLTTAKRGTMKTTPDERYLVFTLYDGYNYEEIIQDDRHSKEKPFRRTEFSKQIRKFDLSAFNLTRTDKDLFRSNHQMLDLSQLNFFIDSLQNKINERQSNFFDSYERRFRYYSNLDTAKYYNLDFTQKDDLNPGFIFKAENIDMIISNAADLARTNNEFLNNNHKEFHERKRSLARYEIEYQRKFTLSVACIILFLIGAPMGAIIRKGGFGLPLVIAVLFFVVFHVTSVTGEKFVREAVIPAWQGMWIAPVLLLPVGILLSVKATTDSSMLNIENYTKKFESLVRIIKKLNKKIN